MTTSAATFSTRDLLCELGFQADGAVYSDESPGLSFDFGNLQLSASWVMNRRFTEIVLLSGVLITPRTISEICDEFPRSFESREQGLAWLAWCLDQHGDHQGFAPVRQVSWLEEGRRNQHLLPWEQKRAADQAMYDACPKCLIERDWARLGLNILAGQLATAPEQAAVTFEFDGSVMTIRCGGDVIPMKADGKPWPRAYAIEAQALRQLPRRLQARIEVLVGESTLSLGNRIYRPLLPLSE